MVFHTAGYGVTMETLASTAANFMGGVRPEIMAFAGGGKKRKATKKKAPKRKASKKKATKRKITKRKVTKRKVTKRKISKRIPGIKKLTQGDRKKRLKQRLNDRKIRRSIIQDIESGKHAHAKKKMKKLSSKSKQSSMKSFLSSIESGSMPSSSAKSLRLSDMTGDTK